MNQRQKYIKSRDLRPDLNPGPCHPAGFKKKLYQTLITQPDPNLGILCTRTVKHPSAKRLTLPPPRISPHLGCARRGPGRRASSPPPAASPRGPRSPAWPRPGALRAEAGEDTNCQRKKDKSGTQTRGVGGKKSTENEASCCFVYCAFRNNSFLTLNRAVE